MNFNMFNNIGYIEHAFSEQELTPVKSEVQEFISNNKQYTWGNIDNEFRMIKSKSHIERLLNPIRSEFEREFKVLENINIFTRNVPLVLDNVWVNFQRKNEFLPLHNHGGVYSFVIWIQVPFDIKDERMHEHSRYPATIKHNLAGNFQFAFTDTQGRIQLKNIPVDKKFENKMMMFPASMYHIVYPFYTSDEPRISISGNYRLQV